MDSILEGLEEMVALHVPDCVKIFDKLQTRKQMRSTMKTLIEEFNLYSSKKKFKSWWLDDEE